MFTCLVWICLIWFGVLFDLRGFDGNLRVWVVEVAVCGYWLLDLEVASLRLFSRWDCGFGFVGDLPFPVVLVGSCLRLPLMVLFEWFGLHSRFASDLCSFLFSLVSGCYPLVLRFGRLWLVNALCFV